MLALIYNYLMLTKTLFHLHTVISGDSEIELEDLVEYAKAVKINVLVLLEHYEAVKKYGLANYFHTVEKSCRDNFLILPGIEVSTNQGLHIGVLGLNTGLAENLPLDAQNLINYSDSHTGFSVILHPSNSDLEALSLMDLSGVSAIEVWNSHRDSKYTFNLGAYSFFLSFKQKYPNIIPLAGVDLHSWHQFKDLIIEADLTATSQKEFLSALTAENYRIVCRQRVVFDRGRLLLNILPFKILYYLRQAALKSGLIKS